MSDLPNKKELEIYAYKYASDSGDVFQAYKDAAHYQHHVSYAQGRADLFKCILKNITDVGLENTLDWIKFRGQFEIDRLKPLETLNDE